MFRFRPILLALLLAAPLACKPPFDPKLYPSVDKLYQVAMAEYKAGRYDNAAKAFEKLTLDLSARDPRLPLAFYYLAQSQTKQGQNLASYPDSPYAGRAKQELSRLDEWLAEKDYTTGYLYLKRKAYDSAILYFKDVIRLHPNAAKTREAYLRLLEAYRAIKYTEDARDLCDAMRKAYQDDREVRRACGPAPATPST